MKKQKLEVMLDCETCEKETPHTYQGYHGVPWSPIYIYKCRGCGMTQHSKRKYDIRSEMSCKEEEQ